MRLYNKKVLQAKDLWKTVTPQGPYNTQELKTSRFVASTVYKSVRLLPLNSKLPMSRLSLIQTLLQMQCLSDLNQNYTKLRDN